MKKIKIDLTDEQEQAIEYFMEHSPGVGLKSIDAETVEDYVTQLINLRINSLVNRFKALSNA